MSAATNGFVATVDALAAVAFGLSAVLGDL